MTSLLSRFAPRQRNPAIRPPFVQHDLQAEECLDRNVAVKFSPPGKLGHPIGPCFPEQIIDRQNLKAPKEPTLAEPVVACGGSMSRLAGHGRAKFISGTRLGTSHGRGWEGLLAERWRLSRGDLGEIQPRDTEVIVMLRGRHLHVRRRVDGQLQRHDAVPGMVWLCPAGIREDMIRLSRDVEESLHLFLPETPLGATALRELDLDPNKIRLRHDGGFYDPLVAQIAWAVHSEMIDAAPAGKVLVETLATALRVHLLRRYSNLQPAPKSLPAARGALDARRLQRVTDFIDTHVGEDLSIKTLANQACLSPFHFARAFKLATGASPHRYLIERRINRAKTLIAEGQIPIAAIASASGFSSQAHLTHWFKRIVGVTPGAYRSA